jgi:hypothetical protein
MGRASSKHQSARVVVRAPTRAAANFNVVLGGGRGIDVAYDPSRDHISSLLFTSAGENHQERMRLSALAKSGDVLEPLRVLRELVGGGYGGGAPANDLAVSIIMGLKPRAEAIWRLPVQQLEKDLGWYKRSQRANARLADIFSVEVGRLDFVTVHTGGAGRPMNAEEVPRFEELDLWIQQRSIAAIATALGDRTWRECTNCLEIIVEVSELREVLGGFTREQRHSLNGGRWMPPLPSKIPVPSREEWARLWGQALTEPDELVNAEQFLDVAALRPLFSGLALERLRDLAAKVMQEFVDAQQGE